MIAALRDRVWLRATAMRARIALFDAPAIDPEAHAFPDDNATFAAGGGGHDLALTVPRLAGLTELVVERARLQLLGTRVPQPPVVATPTSPHPSVTLGDAGSADTLGALGEIRLSGLDIAKGSAPASLGAIQVPAAEGSPPQATQLLHFLVRRVDDGQAGPPIAAVPSYSMPGAGRNLYQAVLGGMTLTQPSSDVVRLTLSPPLDARAVELRLGLNQDADSDLPNQATDRLWSATQVEAVWQTAPRDLKVAAKLGAASAPVGDFPGELPQNGRDLDFTPVARSLLGAAAKTGTGDLALTLSFSSKGTGQLDARGIAIRAHYRHLAVGPAGAPIALTGAPAPLTLPVPPGLTPLSLTLTVDGRFGPTRLVAAADDGAVASRRRGFRLAETTWVARRMSLTETERHLPLTRVGLHGRASGDTEVLLSLHAGTETRIGAALGAPVAMVVAPANDPSWQRAALAPDLFTSPLPEAVWVVARVSRGTFWWYADPDAAGPTQSSGDAGVTWTALTARPGLQLHVESVEVETAPITLRWPRGPLADDLLQLPAAVSQAQMAGIEAFRTGVKEGDAAIGAGAVTLTPVSAAPSGGGRGLSFRKEGLAPLDAPARAAVPDLGKELVLEFGCRRDVDMRVLDAVLTYDPWKAKVS